MAVRRIVPNLHAPDPARARAFYADLLGLEAVMDHGWIVTFADMITLLLAFFVLLLSFSDLDPNRFKDVSGSLQKSLGRQGVPPPVVAPSPEAQLAAGGREQARQIAQGLIE